MAKVTFRHIKGSPLTHAEMDVNLGLFYHSSSLEGSNLELYYSSSNGTDTMTIESHSIDLSSFLGDGDITAVNITAGDGLNGSQNTTSGAHTQTLTIDTSSGHFISGSWDTLSAGTGITVSDGTITNSSPDQTVTVEGENITVNGTYPNFQLTGSSGDQTVTIAGQNITVNGTYPNFQLTGSSIVSDSDSYISNITKNGGILTFTDGGDGQAFSGTVNLNSLTGSLYYSSSIDGNDITFFQGDGTDEVITVPGTDLEGTDIISSSTQITDLGFISQSGAYYSSSIATNVITFFQDDGTTETVTIPAGADNYVSNVTFSDGDLTFTGVNSGFDGTVDLGTIISASTFSSPSQGTLRTITNGFQNDVDLGVQTTDNVTFNRITASADSLINGHLTVTGNVTAQEFHTELISSSIIYESGSTQFGDSSDDNHTFTGSLRVNGNILGDALVKGNTAQFTGLGSAASEKTSVMINTAGELKTRELGDRAFDNNTYDNYNHWIVSGSEGGLEISSEQELLLNGGIGINTSASLSGGGNNLNITVDLTELTLGSGLDADDASTLNLDLTEVIANDGANKVLTSDGDGTLTAETVTISAGEVTAANFITTSDKRLKSEIKPIAEGLETIKQFVSYEYLKNDKKEAGFIAQEVQQAIPYAVAEGDDGFLTMNDRPVLAHLHKAILQLEERLSVLEKKIG